MFGTLTGLLRTYTRAFLSQGVGIVGLAWCLVENLAWASLALAILVLADQALFLRGRWRAPDRDAPLSRALDLWCLVVSALDVLLVIATTARGLGVQDRAGHLVTGPLSCFAFAVAAFTHVDLGLVPTTDGGRLLAVTTALLGDAILLGALTLLLRVRPGTAPRS